MSGLRELTPWGVQELRRATIADGAPPEQAPEEWLSDPLPSRVDLTRAIELTQRLGSVRPREDAVHAATLHDVLPLERRIAGRARFWAWLSAFPLYGYSQARWAKEGRLGPDRIGTQLHYNALARLWWTAESTRVADPATLCDALEIPISHDPYHFTHWSLRSADLNQNLVYRRLSLSSAAHIAVAVALNRALADGAEVRRVLKQFNLTLSTTLLETFDAPFDPHSPYRVDPPRVAALVEHISALIKAERRGDTQRAAPPIANPVVPKPTPRDQATERDSLP